MNHVKLCAFCLSLAAVAAPAGADEGRFAAFSCGLKLGDTIKLEKTFSAPGQDQQYAARPMAQRFQAYGTGAFKFTAAPSLPPRRQRTPTEFTFARLVCTF